MLPNYTAFRAGEGKSISFSPPQAKKMLAVSNRYKPFLNAASFHIEPIVNPLYTLHDSQKAGYPPDCLRAQRLSVRGWLAVWLSGCLSIALTAVALAALRSSRKEAAGGSRCSMRAACAESSVAAAAWLAAV